MSFTLQELATYTSAQLVGDPTALIVGVNTLEEATEKDASFLANPRYLQAMRSSIAGVICIAPDIPLLEGRNYLISQNPSQTFQQIAERLIPSGSSAFKTIHPTAVIHETAILGKDVVIGPYAVIDQNTTIGDGTVIGPHVSIGYEVQIGANCSLFPSSIVRERCRLGNRVVLQPGAVIGSCGFGFIPTATGHQKLQQLGIVILEDDVEIGANTTIDRSRFKATIIRRGSKIDNLCQIAHNVEIGEDNLIIAQVGIAGSSKTGKRVILGGQVGVVGHVEMGDDVMVSSQSGVSKSLKTGKYRGSPAIPMQEYHRQEIFIRKLEEYVQKIKALSEKVTALEHALVTSVVEK